MHLWLADASPTLWAAGADDPAGPLRRRRDASGRSVRHPLARSLGRDARELRLRLAALRAAGTPVVDGHLPSPAEREASGCAKAEQHHPRRASPTPDRGNRRDARRLQADRGGQGQ